jgi:hypothetical protein
MKQTLPGIVGHGQASCTKFVDFYHCLHRDGSGRKVVFVDTPGFDDTHMKDSEILVAISGWLTAT